MVQEEAVLDLDSYALSLSLGTQLCIDSELVSPHKGQSIRFQAGFSLRVSGIGFRIQREGSPSFKISEFGVHEVIGSSYNEKTMAFNDLKPHNHNCN